MRVAAAAVEGIGPENFQIPAAPDLVPEGPWKAVEGSINAPKGFKSAGEANPF